MVVQLQTGERIHYLGWEGGEARPLVLVHGLARTAWTWLPIGRRLAPAHALAAPDLRGHGASDAGPSGSYGYETLADDLEAEGRAVHLIGGAFEARELDAKHAIRQGSQLAARL